MLLMDRALGFAMIVLIEGTVLRLIRWGSWKIAFGHAFIINLVTSLIGTGLLLFIQGRTNSADSAASIVHWSFFADRHRGNNRAKGAPAVRLVLSGYRELAASQYLLLRFPRLDDLS